jgi:SHS2 domain-containing protein
MAVTARHAFLAHTAETVLRVDAQNLEGLWAEACRAIGQAFVEEVGAGATGADRRLTVEAVDTDAVLVDLLNELIYIAETECWAPRHAETVAWERGRLTLLLSGVTLAAPPTRIKGATHHGARIVSTTGGVWSEVILDV